MHFIYRSTCFLAVLSCAICSEAQLFGNLEPNHGGPGDTIVLNAEGIDPVLTHTVTVGGISAAVTGVSSTAITFVVPSGATSGFPVVGIDGFEIAIGDELTVTRQISVQTNSPVPLTGFIVGTAFGDEPWSVAGNTATIAVGKPTLVAATGMDFESALFSFATDSTAVLDLSAQSTSTALLMLSFVVFSADPSVADARLAFLGTLPDIQNLEALIESDLTAGLDYLENPAIDGLIAGAVLAFHESGLLDPAPRPFPSSLIRRAEDFANVPLDFSGGTPKDLKLPGNLALLDRLTSTAKAAENDDRNIANLGIEYTPSTIGVVLGVSIALNPLDWIVSVYELDPFQPAFENGIQDVNELTNGSGELVYQRLEASAIDRVTVPAKPLSKQLDFVGRMSKAILESTILDASRPPASRIPADRSGVYLVRAHSGARFPPQEQLIANLPRGDVEHFEAKKMNILMAVVESMVAVGDSLGVISDDKVTRKLYAIGVKVIGDVERARNRGELDAEFVALLFVNTFRQTVDVIVKAALEAGLKQILKVMEGVLKVVSVVTKVGAIIERVEALNNVLDLLAPPGTHAYSAQSVETTIAVVGDPWQPEIKSFFPQRGHRGTEVRINGRRFSSDRSILEVVFNTQQPTTTDPNPPLFGAAEVMEILEASPTSITVKVPEAASVGAGEIRVRVGSRGQSSTVDLDPPFQSFQVIDNPIITAVNPSTTVQDALIEIVGINFAPRREDNLIRFASDEGDFPRPPLAVVDDGTRLLVRVSFGFVSDVGTSSDSVTVEVTGNVSNSFGFTVEKEGAFFEVLDGLGGEFKVGSAIEVSTSADGDNIADGNVTLREALLIAAGSRSFSVRPQGDSTSPLGSFESDFIGGCPDPEPDPELNFCRLGPSFTHSIGGFEGGSVTVVLDSALPPLSSGIELGGISIDGNNLNIDGFVINGQTEVDIFASTISNFGGSGIRLMGGARRNIIVDVITRNCLHGVFLDTSATQNIIESTQARTSTSHGFLLSGAGVTFNTFTAVGDSSFNNGGAFNNTGFGVSIENGAAGNRVDVGIVQGNQMGGIRVTGTGTTLNKLGGTSLGGIFDSDVIGNLGPGVLIQTGPNTVAGLRIGGNTGDGILVEGEGALFVDISHTEIGFDEFGTANPNLGSGIHVRGGASNINIGSSTVPVDDAETSLLYIAGNRDHGIWLEGTGSETLDPPIDPDPNVHDITIRATLLGLTSVMDGSLSATPLVAPNGLNGIRISDAAHDIVIGSSDPYLGVVASGHVTGAGLLIEGFGTKNVRVANSAWGHPLAIFSAAVPLGNLHGIHLKAGARNVVIGTRGDFPTTFVPKFDEFVFFPDYMLNFGTAVLGNLGSGIFLDNAGPESVTQERGAPPITPVGGHVIQNVGIGTSLALDSFDNSLLELGQGNQVGILISGDSAFGNRIGGSEPDEGNLFAFNIEAGLKIENSDLAGQPANRIIGNTFEYNGPFGPPSDPLGLTPEGMGVYVLSSSRHSIGGIGPGEGNTFRLNSVGIQVRNSEDIFITSNQIGTDDQDGTLSFTEGGHKVAGVLLVGAATTTVGPGNTIILNGFDPFNSGLIPRGGVFITGGFDNRVIGNWIGTESTETLLLGNNPNGIAIENSVGNTIGLPARSLRNIVVDSLADGILLDAGATGNIVASNHIGEGSGSDSFFGPNAGAGVMVRNGATMNSIGGPVELNNGGSKIIMDAGNFIRNNLGGGVVVEGSTTIGNSILNNSITGHPALGIDNVNGGNSELPPPVITLFNGVDVFGTVDDTVVPDGSTVQVFSDSDTGDEGEVFEESGKVVNGAFVVRVGAPSSRSLRATVTHATTKSTSEFGPAKLIEPVLDVSRTGSAASALAQRLVPAPAMPFTLTTGETHVKVSSISVTASGSIDETTALSSLTILTDRDGDGLPDEFDVQVAGPIGFSTDNGPSVFPMNLVLDPDTTTGYVLVAKASSTAPAGGTMIFTITSQLSVISNSIFPSAAIIESGTFPLVSDTLTIEDTMSTAEVADSLRAPFDQLDTNGDGFLSMAESGISAVKFELIDLNGDGLLSNEELLAVAIGPLGVATQVWADFTRTSAGSGIQPDPFSKLKDAIAFVAESGVVTILAGNTGETFTGTNVIEKALIMVSDTPISIGLE